MKKVYEKPMAMATEEYAEGVYMASGSTVGKDCWDIQPKSVQSWNGWAHVFEIKITHSKSVEHISNATTAVLTFNHAITSASAEGNCSASVSGNKVTVVRTLHANGYKSGDVATYKVFAVASDEATTKALAITGATITCSKAANVHGILD